MTSIHMISSSPSWDSVLQIAAGIKENTPLVLNATGIATGGEALVKEVMKTDGGCFKHLECLSVIGGLFAIKDIVQTAGKFAHAKAPRKIESAFVIASNIGDVGASVSSFARFLKGAGAVTEKAIAWIKPLGIVCTGFEVIGVSLNVKRLVNTCRMATQFKQATGLEKKDDDYTFADYQKGVQLILDHRVKDQDFIKDHFYKNETELAHRLMVIGACAQQKIASADLKDQAEGKRSLRITMQTLSQRLTTKKWSHTLSLVAGVISLVAGLVLLFTPLAPLGLGLMVLGSVISLGSTFIYKRIMDKQFQKAMEDQYRKAVGEVSKKAMQDIKQERLEKAYKEQHKKVMAELKIHACVV